MHKSIHLVCILALGAMHLASGDNGGDIAAVKLGISISPCAKTSTD